MNKRIAALAVAAALGGTAVGSTVGGLGVAGAAQSAANSATGAASWVGDALAGLVEDGTITQSQADKVESTLREAKPPRAKGGHGHMKHRVDFTAVANALGVSPADLRSEMRAGKTLSEIAEARDVELSKVIDAMVAEHAARLAEKVEAGTLTQAEADAKLAKAKERATRFAQGQKPSRSADATVTAT